MQEYGALLGVSARAAEQVAAAQTERTSFEGDANAYFRDVRAHNANVCTHPENQPEVCAAYTARQAELNRRHAALVTRESETAHRLRMARSAFEMSMARFRIMAVLAGWEAWRRRVVGCADIIVPLAMASRRCLTEAWEHHP